MKSPSPDNKIFLVSTAPGIDSMHPNHTIQVTLALKVVIDKERERERERRRGWGRSWGRQGEGREQEREKWGWVGRSEGYK